MDKELEKHINETIKKFPSDEIICINYSFDASGFAHHIFYRDGNLIKNRYLRKNGLWIDGLSKNKNYYHFIETPLNIRAKDMIFNDTKFERLILFKTLDKKRALVKDIVHNIVDIYDCDRFIEDNTLLNIDYIKDMINE